MRVTLLTSLAGHGWSLDAGDPHDCSDAEAASLIAAGLAEPIRIELIETADLPNDQETASIQTAGQKTPKPRRRSGGQ